jgi:hypothetical protein
VCVETESGRARGHQCTGSATPDPDLEERAGNVAHFSHQTPELVAPPHVDERVATNALVHLDELVVDLPWRVGRDGIRHLVGTRTNGVASYER